MSDWIYHGATSCKHIPLGEGQVSVAHRVKHLWLLWTLLANQAPAVEIAHLPAGHNLA